MATEVCSVCQTSFVVADDLHAYVMGLPEAQVLGVSWECCEEHCNQAIANERR